MQSQVMIEACGLTKRFGEFVAVNGIDFEVEAGECFGLLGPNGAGKSSTIRMICCVSPITSGTLRVLGMDPRTEARQIKARLGVVPQDDNLDSDLTAVENLRAYARYFDVPSADASRRAEEVLDLMALSEKANAKIDSLSGGMKRRLTVARALMSSPEMLILDEPTTGLDPQARQLAWQKLRQLKREGMTMLLTTHYMEEAAQLCDRVIIMDGSEIIERGRPAELVERIIGREVVEVHLREERRQETLEMVSALAGNYLVEETHDVAYIFERDGVSAAALDLRSLSESSDIMLRKASLEDVFLRLTGRDVNE